MPIIALLDENRAPLTIFGGHADRKVFARIWEMEVGAVHLYLLDTDIEQNSRLTAN